MITKVYKEYFHHFEFYSTAKAVIASLPITIWTFVTFSGVRYKTP
jgi:hypothetical protein